MPEGGRPVYCGNCGSIVGSDDRFCGVCGAEIPSDAQDAAPVEQPPTLVQPPPQARSRRGFGNTFLAAALGTVVILLVVGVGAAAFVAFGPGSDLLGASREAPTNDPPTTVPASPESPTSSSIAPDSSPDPAFDPLLDELGSRTSSPIMLPASLPEQLRYVAVDDAMSEEEYGTLFFLEPPDGVVEGFVGAEVFGTLTATPEPEAVSNEFYEASSVKTVGLPSGTEATLRYMEPITDGGTDGPFWQGRFDKYGLTYELVVQIEDPNSTAVEEALTSMVLVREPRESADTPPSVETTTTGEPPLEETIQEFVSDYYEAVARDDWGETYLMLDETAQAEFAEDEWMEVQTTRDESQAASRVDSATVESIGGLAGLTATVTLSYSDGSTETLEILVVQEADGTIKRQLTEDEISYLQGLEGEAGTGNEEDGITAIIESHYRAIGAGNFEEAYSYFGPTFRSNTDEATWISDEESYEIEGSSINAIEVEEVSGESATANVDVSFLDNAGSPQFLLIWALVEEGGEWKLDEVIDSEEVE